MKELAATMDYKIFSLLFVVLPLYLAFVTAECPADKDKDWSYDSNLPNGPPHWGKKYPNCNGKSQSPINIITKDVEKSGKRQRLELHGYDEPITKVMIMNNGHHIHVMPKDGVKRYITVDGEKYEFMHLHFHWGNHTSKGSEDVINGKRHTMETHFIHHDSKGKVVAVGGFLEESHELNSAIDNILAVKEAFQYEGTHYEGEIKLASRDSHRQGKIYLEDLIDGKCPYYRYEGSVGFPPCTEGVTWLICRRSKAVCSYQMNQLFSLYSVKKGTSDEDKCHLVNIYRPLQPLNGRKVYS